MAAESQRKDVPDGGEDAVGHDGGPSVLTCIAGGLCVWFGVSSIAEMVEGLFCDALMFNIGIVGIPIGYGVMIGRDSSRMWAKFWSWLTVIGCVIGVVVMVVQGLRSELYYPDFVYAGVILPLVFAGAVLVLRALRRARDDGWFDAVTERVGTARKVAWSVGILTLMVEVGRIAEDWWQAERQEMVYQFDVRVLPFDAETNEGLRSLSYEGTHSQSTMNFADKFAESYPKVTVSSGGSPGNMGLRLYGSAIRDFDFEFGSDGYLPVKVRVTRDMDPWSEKEIRVGMRRDATVRKEEPEAGEGED